MTKRRITLTTSQSTGAGALPDKVAEPVATPLPGVDLGDRFDSTSPPQLPRTGRQRAVSPLFAPDNVYVTRVDSIAQNVPRWGQLPAVTDIKGSVTFAQLDEMADKIAAFLLKTTKGLDRRMVAVYTSRNMASFFAISLACRRAGLSYTNFVNTLSASQLTDQLLDHPYRILFVDSAKAKVLSGHRAELKEKNIIIVDLSAADNVPGSLAQIVKITPRPRAAMPGEDEHRYEGPVFYTSGSVKEPKRIPVKPGKTTGIEANKYFNVGTDDIHLLVGRLYHGAALSWSQGHLKRGAHIVLHNHHGFRFYPKQILRDIEKFKVTTLWVCPAWLNQLVDVLEEEPALFDLSSLRGIYIGTAPFTQLLKERAIAVFGPIFWDNYATTETGSISILKPDEMLAHPGTVGRPLSNVEVQILGDDHLPLPVGQIGRIFVKSPMTNDDFFETGDEGFFDADGFLSVVGRRVERIYLEGKTIYARPLEAFVSTFPGIRESHAVWREQYPGRLVLVVLKNRGAVVNDDEIIKHVKNKYGLSDQSSVEIVYLNTLPRKPYKVDHRKLVEIIIHDEQIRSLETNNVPSFACLLPSFLAGDNFEPRVLVDFLKIVPGLSYLWPMLASPANKLTLEQHTLRVLHQFETYFTNEPLPQGMTRAIMRLILAVHDLGKPIAVAERNLTKEHTETSLLIQRTFRQLDIDPKVAQLATTLVSFVFGHFIRGVRLIKRMDLAIKKEKSELITDFEKLIQREYELTDQDSSRVISDIRSNGASPFFVDYLKSKVIKKVRENAASLQIAAKDFFDLLVIYHKVDASTYTSHANRLYGNGEEGRLDDLFVIDDEQNTISYAEPMSAFVDEIKEELALSPNPVNDDTVAALSADMASLGGGAMPLFSALRK
ncbi:MAG: hypothetical protein ACD_73C00721G0002 [uncultured bacterium]|nr:MAG: hypothetical protein ACD_73C00721G0002 [uncultured bacterium]